MTAPATLHTPNETFMRYFQNPVWNFLCDHYFRLEIEGWHRVPDEPALLIGIHSGGSLTMDAWTLVHSWYRHFNDAGAGRRVLHGTAHDVLMAAPGLGDYFREILEPVHVDTDPERAEDTANVDAIYTEVERAIQAGMDRLAKRRSFPVLG